MAAFQRLTNNLWFDTQAEEAAKFYVSVFKNSAINAISYYGKAGFEIHRRPEGSVMTVDFTLDGHTFTALNGGPHFKFNEAVSFIVNCKNQEEVDYYWSNLTKGGDERAQQCGWLKDKFGVSWQVVPAEMIEMMTDKDPAKKERVMDAMLKMKKLDLEKLKQAFRG